MKDINFITKSGTIFRIVIVILITFSYEGFYVLKWCLSNMVRIVGIFNLLKNILLLNKLCYYISIIFLQNSYFLH